MPRHIKNASRSVKAGSAEWVDAPPKENEGADIALARSVADLADKLAFLGREQLDAVMDAAKQMSITSKLMLKMIENQDWKKLKFRVTERDGDYIKEFEAERTE